MRWLFAQVIWAQTTAERVHADWSRVKTNFSNFQFSSPNLFFLKYLSFVCNFFWIFFSFFLQAQRMCWSHRTENTSETPLCRSSFVCVNSRYFMNWRSLSPLRVDDDDVKSSFTHFMFIRRWDMFFFFISFLQRNVYTSEKYFFCCNWSFTRHINSYRLFRNDVFSLALCIHNRSPAHLEN